MKKSTVREKMKQAQNFLTKLRFLADEVGIGSFVFTPSGVCCTFNVSHHLCCSLNTAFLTFSYG